MKIDSIILHNFKSFEGTCRINGLSEDLTDQKKIILIGGLNGSGKTTIFEAILLCLYGRKNKTLWPSKGTKREDYRNYMIAVTNNNAKNASLRTDLWIEVTLKDIELASMPFYLTVRRTWMIDSSNNSLVKDGCLDISGPDGDSFDLVHKDAWDQFIDELIPYDVSQFFFFDGEKIQDFVKDEDREFALSLEKVLGISLYDQLNSDLEEVRRRIVREYNKDEDAKVQMAQIDAQIAEIEQNMRKESETVARVNKEIREIEEKIEEIDLATRRITRIQTETLEGYRAQKEGLLQEKGSLEQRIFEAIQDELPFVIAASLCQDLTIQLDKEAGLAEFMAAQQALEPKIQSIASRLFEADQDAPTLSIEQRQFYARKLVQILKETLTEKPVLLQDVEMLHNLSKNDFHDIQQRIQNTYQTVQRLSKTITRLQEVERQLTPISQAEKQSDDPEAKRLYEERGKKVQEQATKQVVLERLKVQIDRHEADATAKRRQRTDLEKRASQTVARQNQIDYTKQLRSALEEFSHRLRAKKVSLLQEFTLEMWHKLARKKDQVKEIQINPNKQFSVELYDAKDRLIDKTKLSAGEKELLAISLIWALARLANRNLPVVIDTPLGRLDRYHRANIAANYFSSASHQVILLSTNTEIVGKEYEAVQPFLSKEYLLTKDTAQKTTTVSEGYFQAK